MSETLVRVQALVAAGQVKVSAHGYDELVNDGISIDDAVEGVADAQTVEDYPDYAKGPCCLVLQHDGHGEPIHVVWGIPRGSQTPAVLITAYRPDPESWSEDLLRRST